jgi:hypothetical protein
MQLRDEQETTEITLAPPLERSNLVTIPDPTQQSEPTKT